MAIRLPRSPDLLLVPALAVLLIGSGCKKPDDSGKKSDARPSSQPATSSSAPVLAGPCGDLQKKICAAAGEQSSLCAAAPDAYGVLSDAACTAALKDIVGTEKKIKDDRKVCQDLVVKLCAGVGPETETCKMVTEKTQQFPKERCESMLPQVEAIIVDLKRQEMANQPLSADLQATIASKDAPSFGPENAKVTVVEFSDFQCPYCSRAAEVSQKIREKYGDKVRFVFRHFPLSFHQDAGPAAEASMAAHAQGKFWEYHDKLFANQQKLDGVSLEGYAQEAGLDMAKFKAAMQSKEYGSIVKADLKMGEDVAVQGTPTMFVNGERVGNPTDFSSVAQLIDKLLGS
jgi:protein-disulfide isomerase